MRITRVSSLTGIQRTREVDIRPDELDQWRSGVHPDISLSRLTTADREFVTTGICDLDHDIERTRSQVADLRRFDQDRIEDFHRAGVDGRRQCPCCGTKRASTRRSRGAEDLSHRTDDHQQVPGGWKLR